MKLIKFSCFFVLMFPSITCQANIDNLLKEIAMYESKISGYDANIQDYTQSVSNSMMGNYGVGETDFKDYQSYGNGGNTWSNVLNSVKNGGSDSSLGGIINGLSSNYSNQTKTVNGVVTDSMAQQYYALQSQNAIAARAAAEEDFNKIQSQLDYQDELRKKIDNTQNIKEATDLTNRLQVESNRIQLEMLRSLAIKNQLQAVENQGAINDAALNANLLTWRP